MAERVLLKTPDASVSLAKDAKIDSKRVLLNSPDSATDPTPHPAAEADEHRARRPARASRSRTVGTWSPSPTAPEMSGLVDKNGKAEIEIEGAATIAFPGLRGPKAA